MILHARGGFFPFEAIIRNNRKPQPAKTVLPDKHSDEQFSRLPRHIQRSDLGVQRSRDGENGRDYH
jgi:hypothetical protein